MIYPMKVVVGMSGGIDSSYAAYLLKQAGHKVEGLSFILFETRGRAHPSACCSLEALKDAERAARHMGIPHRSLDLRAAFLEKVVEPFVGSYLKGLTPNPCILCNREIKFPYLLEEAGKSGAGFIATGHYARVEKETGRAVLKTGVDRAKDQSYVLYALRRKELESLLLPLGGLTKAETRRGTGEAGLPLSGRPESQEICFVENRYGSFIHALEPEAGKPGPIMDQEGKTLGIHKGIHAYTVGQRKGLGVASPEPLYVTTIDAKTNTVFVGPREAARKREVLVRHLNWLEARSGGFSARVKVRSTMQAAPARVIPAGEDAAWVEFDEPQFAPAPGQSAVFYEEDIVIGGGVIQPS